MLPLYSRKSGNEIEIELSNQGWSGLNQEHERISQASIKGDDLPDSYKVLFRILYSITTGIEKSSIREIFFQAILNSQGRTASKRYAWRAGG
jgi:hypothetical protein